MLATETSPSSDEEVPRHQAATVPLPLAPTLGRPDLICDGVSHPCTAMESMHLRCTRFSVVPVLWHLYYTAFDIHFYFLVLILRSPMPVCALSFHDSALIASPFTRPCVLCLPMFPRLRFVYLLNLSLGRSLTVLTWSACI